jgi:ABC-type cobalamin transport system ATPase subunit
MRLRSAPPSGSGRTIRTCRSRGCRAAISRRSWSGAGSPRGRKLLVAEDPTAGVDVGAKAEIYRLIARALEDGLAVVVVSTDFEEIAHICHRALVFNRGRIIAELAGPALTTEAVITAASASEAA